jgi:hypothetical protein
LTFFLSATSPATAAVTRQRHTINVTTVKFFVVLLMGIPSFAP